MFSYNQQEPFSTNYMKGGMYATTFEGRSYHANLKWAWKGNKLELLTPIALNKKW
jgi:hypothetical protein